MSQKCPQCEVDIQVETMFPKGSHCDAPIPGICLNCIALVVINEDKTVRKPTEEEAYNYSRSNALYNFRTSMRLRRPNPAKPFIHCGGAA